MPKQLKSYLFFKKMCQLDFIDEIWLFGSRARGDNQERSDIDLALICPRATPSDWRLVMEIVNNADTFLKIDCVRFQQNTLTPAFYNNILKDKKVVYMKEFVWKESFDTLGHALARLKDVLSHAEIDELDYLRDASIQRFEFTIELFWKVLKKILAYEKVATGTPRDTLSKAYQYHLIQDEDVWLSMLDDRNNTSHAYKEKEAQIIFEHIKNYYPVFEVTYQALKKKYHL
jgi:nucleotidyltransferase substrate binding protein (TIGR01987 family)